MAAPWEKYQSSSSQVEAGPWSKYGSSPNPTDTKAPKDATEIENNPQWAQRGKTLYKAANGKDFTGSDQEAAKWLGDYIYDFNHRLINAGSNENGGRGTLDIAYNLKDFSPEAKQAFIDSQHDYENMGYSWKGAGKAAERIFTDPFTYATLGAGKIVSKVLQKGATETVEELAKQGVKQGVTKGLTYGAAEGGVYGGGLDAANQYGMINAGGQDSYDPVRGATATGLGAATGGVLGAGVGAVTGGLAGRKPIVQAARQLVDNPEDAKLGAEVTQRLNDVQVTRGSKIGIADANASLDVQKNKILEDVNNLGLPRDQVKRIKTALDKAKGMTEADTQALQGIRGGQEIIDNIAYFKKFRDMTAPETSSSNRVLSGLRVLADQLPTAPLRYGAKAVLGGRRNGTDVIAERISPRNLDIANNITELGGPSKASIARDSLTSMAADAARAQKLAKDVAEQARLDKAYSFKERAIDAVKRNDPPVPDSPQGVMEDATGMDRSQVAQALRIVERRRPLLKAQVNQYRKSVATGGRIEDFNALIRAVRKLGDEGVVPRAREPNSGNQVMMQGMANAAYSPAMAQANANQSRITQSIGRIASESVPEADKQAINTAIATIGKTNNRQEALQVQLELMGKLSDPKAQEIANREIMPLIAQIRHEKPKGK